MRFESRILNASLASYGIPNQVETNPLGIKVGFIDPVTAFEASKDGEKIDACYVGETDHEIILSFRGTIGLPDNLIGIVDWMNNLMANSVKVDGLPGTVHQGFSDSITRLLDTRVNGRNFAEEVNYRAAKSSKKIVVTGYSKGGGLAPIATMYLDKKYVKRTQIMTFEAPRCGDGEFKKGLEKRLGVSIFSGKEKIIRYEYQDDIVPHVPPTKELLPYLEAIPLINEMLKKYNTKDWNYKHVGTLRFINWDDIEQEVQGLDIITVATQRIFKLQALLKEGLIAKSKMLTDHLPNPISKTPSPKNQHIYKVVTGEDYPKDAQRENS
jgi:hypothetical protein